MKYEIVAVGGTFDHFHRGHEKLLNKAFEIGSYIMVGVTSNEFGGRKGHIEPCSQRMSELEQFLQKFGSKYTVKRLEDHYGPSINDPKIDAIVVSKETEPVAHKINEIRQEKGIKPLKIFVIGWVLAEDGKPISSTRIRNGEIDRNGKVIK